MGLKAKYRRIAQRGHTGCRCWYCGIPLGRAKKRERPTFEHQHPESRGGRRGSNLVLACSPCNNAKADMTVEEYRWHLQEQLPAGERVIFFAEAVSAGK